VVESLVLGRLGPGIVCCSSVCEASCAAGGLGVLILGGDPTGLRLI
jgi:hypothetical protein